MACFDGDYPIPLPEEARLGKHLLEELAVPADSDRPVGDTVSGAVSGDAGPVRSGPVRSSPVDRPSALLAVGYGAEDALRRP